VSIDEHPLAKARTAFWTIPGPETGRSSSARSRRRFTKATGRALDALRLEVRPEKNRTRENAHLRLSIVEGKDAVLAGVGDVSVPLSVRVIEPLRLA